MTGWRGDKLETQEIVQEKPKRARKKTPYRCVRVNCTFTEQEATDIAEEAQKAGCRSKSAKLVNQKPHGFANEVVYNTKGISKFIRKFLLPAWKKAEITRMQKLEQARALAEEAGGRVEI